MLQQVPKRYCIVGNGKVANHFVHYFELLGLDFCRWFRSQSGGRSLSELVVDADLVLLLISDSAIDAFIEQNPCLQTCRLVHFSGGLRSRYADFCHPLMTFAEELYSQSVYASVAFVHSEDFDFSDCFPELPNCHYTLPQTLQQQYHALCVVAGNLVQMLWQEVSAQFEQMGLSKQLLFAYFRQVVENFVTNPEHCLTGPFERADVATIAGHLKALQGNDLLPIYQQFVDWRGLANQLNEGDL